MADAGIDRSVGMQRVVQELVQRNIDLSSLDALEVFAREGDWQTLVYKDLVRSLEAWEIDPSFEPNLRRNLPHATVRIIDSIATLQQKDASSLSRYTFIVIDNPQNCFGPRSEHCEHFDVLPTLPKIIDASAIVIFNINRHPFSYARFPQWQRRRLEYYGVDASDLTTPFLLAFYAKLFKQLGFHTQWSFSVPREEYEGVDYLHYLVFKLSKSNGLFKTKRVAA